VTEELSDPTLQLASNPVRLYTIFRSNGHSMIAEKSPSCSSTVRFLIAFMQYLTIFPFNDLVAADSSQDILPESIALNERAQNSKLLKKVNIN
jgi:hypothetical protein